MCWLWRPGPTPLNPSLHNHAEVSLWETEHPVASHPHVCADGVNLCPLPQCLYRVFVLEPADQSLTHVSELTLRSDSFKNALPVRTLDGRHVKRNHATQHIAPNCFVCQGYCCLHRAGAHRPWPAMPPDDELRRVGLSGAAVPESVWVGLESSAVSLKLHRGDSLCFRRNDAVWWANFTEMDWAISSNKNVFIFPLHWFL